MFICFYCVAFCFVFKGCPLLGEVSFSGKTKKKNKILVSCNVSIFGLVWSSTSCPLLPLFGVNGELSVVSLSDVLSQLCFSARQLMFIVPCRFNNNWLHMSGLPPCFWYPAKFSVAFSLKRADFQNPPWRMRQCAGVSEESDETFLQNNSRWCRNLDTGSQTWSALPQDDAGNAVIHSVNVSKGRPAAIITWRWCCWYVCLLFISVILFSDLYGQQAAQGGERSEVCSLTKLETIHPPWSALAVAGACPSRRATAGSHPRTSRHFITGAHCVFIYCILLFKRTKLSRLKWTNRKGTQFFIFFHLTQGSVLFLVHFSSNGVSLLFLFTLP